MKFEVILTVPNADVDVKPLTEIFCPRLPEIITAPNELLADKELKT